MQKLEKENRQKGQRQLFQFVWNAWLGSGSDIPREIFQALFCSEKPESLTDEELTLCIELTVSFDSDRCLTRLTFDRDWSMKRFEPNFSGVAFI